MVVGAAPGQGAPQPKRVTSPHSLARSLLAAAISERLHSAPLIKSLSPASRHRRRRRRAIMGYSAAKQSEELAHASQVMAHVLNECAPSTSQLVVLVLLVIPAMRKEAHSNFEPSCVRFWARLLWERAINSGICARVRF